MQPGSKKHFMPCAEKAMEQLENSVPIAGMKADGFDAIYIPGGHGIAVDGPFDPTLRSLISEFAAQGKLVSAVCHGPRRIFWPGAQRQAHRLWQEGDAALSKCAF